MGKSKVLKLNNPTATSKGFQKPDVEDAYLLSIWNDNTQLTNDLLICDAHYATESDLPSEDSLTSSDLGKVFKIDDTRAMRKVIEGDTPDTYEYQVFPQGGGGGGLIPVTGTDYGETTTTHTILKYIWYGTTDPGDSIKSQHMNTLFLWNEV